MDDVLRLATANRADTRALLPDDRERLEALGYLGGSDRGLRLDASFMHHVVFPLLVIGVVPLLL